jgi:lipoprotein-anchoring transpeptidase ErfK/SrfK
MSGKGRAVVVVWSVIASAVLLPAANADANSVCANVLGAAHVSGPTNTVAWRTGLEARTAVFNDLPGKRLHPARWVAPADAPWLLVVSRPRAADRRCWLQVRLPWRPNDAAGWINANNVLAEKTRWRIQVSTARRTLTLFRSGAPIRTVSVVVGKPSTPTPVGLFAIAWAIRWHPNDFLGSWVLELTAHSNVLQQFDGGDGTVGIHGRGGASLLDPLGSARSHGCIRLSNDAIWTRRRSSTDAVPACWIQIGDQRRRPRI